MQIKRLKVDKYKCFRDFEISFQIEEGGCSNILIGENGTGKSTLLEVVLEILMSFDSDAVEKRITYSYEIEYVYGANQIKISQYKHTYNIYIDDVVFANGKIQTIRKKLKEEEKSIFPERINYFYSGLNCKELSSLKQINSNYTKKCRDVVGVYWRATVWAGQTYNQYLPKRKFNNCTDELLPIYLIAILCGSDSYEKSYLQRQCHIESIDVARVQLTLKNLPNDIEEESFGNEQNVMNEILDYLDADFSELLASGLLYQNDNEFIYELHDFSELRKDTVSVFEFFEKLSTLFNATFAVFVKVGNSRVNISSLSEGQRQLIKLFGMLGVSKSENMLVLMDEPDSHMNPKWKYELKKIIDNSLKGAINVQAIIATHDPLVINGVQRQCISIFTYENSLHGNVDELYSKVIEPDDDTKGMGIDGILQSEYYGMETTLDYQTQKLVDEKHNLMIELRNDNITQAQRKRLQAISNELSKMRFATNIPTDSYYDEFAAALNEEYQKRPKKQLDKKEIDERKEIARNIVKRLLKG